MVLVLHLIGWETKVNFSLPITEQSKAKPMQFWLTFATHLNFLNIEIGVDQLTGKRLLFTLVLHTVFFLGQFLSSLECVHI